MRSVAGKTGCGLVMLFANEVHFQTNNTSIMISVAYFQVTFLVTSKINNLGGINIKKLFYWNLNNIRGGFYRLNLILRNPTQWIYI